ncbi:unnamed protein product [Darwinula stevensoni]|uniref:Annexin n=1 Tax=Darwinula stevensoni TaxID=69355 RepID=A0A7R9AA77_9CRUS|nr:unnamed protein product [Darwinula stevensoni]CAG0898154.1 unnamed protein product [Darwinula stevensoni]
MQGTVTEKPSFDGQQAAQRLREAMKGFGTDEQALIDAICEHNNQQRQIIRSKYQALFGRDLLEDIKKETGGRFEDVLVALLMPSTEYLASCLKDAFKGIGTDEDAVIELLCSRAPAEIKAIKKAYQEKYGDSLEDKVQSELTGTLCKVVLSLLAGSRDQSKTVNEGQVQQDVADLIAAGVAQWGTDESVFNVILCNRSFPHLQRLFQRYVQETGSNLTDDISREFSGHAQAALLAIVQSALDVPTFFAQKLQHALGGLGTKDNIVIRILVSRSEMDLRDIKVRYEAMFERSLAEAIRKDMSGDYEKVLLRILGEA